MEKNLSRKSIILILIGIIIIQTICYIIVGTKKSYIHIDEGYSYGLINYNKIDITNNEDFYNTWHDKEYYNDYLSINDYEKNNWIPVYENQKNDVHPPFYYLLLRCMAMFNINEFSMWEGIILNIIIHIGITILMYLISSKLFNNKIYGLLIALVGGLTVSALETVILARMYALTALNILIITYLHMINIDKETISTKSLCLMGLCILIGSLTHYYYLVFLFVLYVMFMIMYIKNKNYKMAIKYTICMALSGAVSLLIFPYSFVHIFMGYRGQGMLSHFTDFSQALIGLAGYLGLTLLDVFNVIGSLVLIILGIIIVIKNKEIRIKIQNKYIGIILVPTLIYFAIIGAGSPYIEIRYIMPIASLIFILGIYALKLMLDKVCNKEKTFKIISIILVIMLIVPIIVKWPITYLYQDKKDIVNKISENHSIPTLYVFNKDQNRFLDDIYLFTKIDNSYIMDSKLENSTNIEEVFKNKNLQNGIIVFINSGLENDNIIKDIKETTNLEECNYVKRMNACDIYYIH